MMNKMGKERGLKKNRIVGIENAVEMKTENKMFEGYQWKISVHSSYVYEMEAWVENYNAFTQKQIQLQWSDVCQFGSEFDKDIEGLWRLMLKHSRGMYNE